ncbi:MAG: rhodanese-like domain-containing protein [Mucilaginibacter sp.]|uniref:MBL fold metallo-hydrolase n=1 Tax=Mucilaginibacter sp. TaxID=1882438 RepID=UPI0034E5CDCB
MKIEQFEDKSLSHYAYAILSDCEKQVVLIDPARDIAPYLDFAKANEAKIIGVIETHPHADFVSSHLELHQNLGATIYCSKLVDAAYPHQTFDDGDVIAFGKIKLKAINTPGHSPDSISVILEHEGKDHAVFTGDTLFIGDCGRPDLRENAGNITAKREELAAQMYRSLREKLMVLADDVLVYPAHGAGTLCGKALSDANSSTIYAEKQSNWSLQKMTEEQFVKALIEDQPFVPKYFSFDVGLNKKGAPGLASSIQKVQLLKPEDLINLEENTVIIDTRPASQFKSGHLPYSINLMENGKFETWLGSIISPEEKFYLTAENETVLQKMIKRTAKIGYETLIKAAFVSNFGAIKTALLDIENFKKETSNYQIVDIRNPNEVAEHPIFQNSLKIPLPELRERANEIPTEKPIVVHCAGGYRSAAGSSILENQLAQNVTVYDLGNAVNEF